jgi:phosphoribosylformimino-5-aminoimidazole carboxamide ribotide isomerase
MSFIVYPAIDVREGRVVRLRQGDYDQETRYAADPCTLAARYAEQGAGWLHLVDLDAAKAGGYTLHALLQRLKSDTGLRVQTGGGVRSEADVAALIDAGADRVVLGSLAINAPEQVAAWISTFGAERIVVALDTRQVDGVWQLPVHGWTAASTWSLSEALTFYSERGLRHLLSTDIDRDGMLAGPNLALYALIRGQAPGLLVQASGGVRNADDVRAARAAGCAGVVLGRALLEGLLDLPAALGVEE